MAITVKFFAHLREQTGKSDEVVAWEPGLTVTDVWKDATGGRPVPESLLVAVNMEYAKGDVELKDGDEVAFFPPVTGG
jgi:molybdopterin synthase sulfur carrier subunit